MKGGVIYVMLLLSMAISAIMAAKPLFDANKCQNGCKEDTDCPANSACVAVNSESSCGLCICSAGYKTKGNKCEPNNPTKATPAPKGKSTKTTTTISTTTESTTSTTSTTAASTTTTTPESTTTSTTTTTLPTTTGTTTQSPTPPQPEPVVCSEYACSVTIPPSNDSNPLEIRSRLYTEAPGCKKKLSIAPRNCNIQGGGPCFGDYCLTTSPGNDYCICSFYRVDRQCAIDKPGSCDSASGKAGGTAVQNKRYRNKGNPDHGSVYGRHFATSVDDCVKLCQWSGNTNCKSVNFGQIQGVNVCEMLSVSAPKGSILESWLVDSPGWQYLIV